MNDMKAIPAMAIVTRGQTLAMRNTDAMRPVHTRMSSARSLESIHSSVGAYQ